MENNNYQLLEQEENQEVLNAEEQNTALAQSDDQEILRVDNLKKYFVIEKSLLGKPLRYLKAVDDVSFSLKKGKTIGVVGESGCGKTTLGRTILKLYDANEGKVYFQGEEITKLSKKQMRKYRTDMQLVFQDPYSSLPPRMTVGSIISEGVKVHKVVPKEEVYNYVMDIMLKCGLQPQYYDRYPHEFSGGQRQRICIARALAVKPKLVICDEPVSALDVSIQAQIINLLKELQNDMGLTYVFISHDLSVVKYVTDDVLVMYLGNMMEKGRTADIFKKPLHPYTKALFSAVPVPNPDVKMNRIILQGDIPSPANPPKGCKFHTRCSECMNVCRFVQPEYREVEEEHFVACHLYDEEVMAHLADYDAQWQQMEKERIEAEEKAKNKKKGASKAVEEEEKENTALTEETAAEETAETVEETAAEDATETVEETVAEDATETVEETAAEDAAEKEEDLSAEEILCAAEDVGITEAVEEIMTEEIPDVEQEDAADDEEEDEAEEEDEDGKAMPFGKTLTRARYSNSFTAKLMLSDEKIKEYYCETANELLSYKKMGYRVYWGMTAMRAGMKTMAKFAIRGKTLYMYLALDPEEFRGTKYAMKDMSAIKRYSAIPARIKLKTPRSVKHAKELIAIMAEKNDLKPAKKQKITLQPSDFPEDTIENLVQKGYVKDNEANS